MILTETTAAAGPAVPVADLAAHLRLNEGFAGDPEADAAQDALLLRLLLAAQAQVEVHTGLMLTERDVRLTVARWDGCGRLVLPVGPVAAIDAVSFTGPVETVMLDAAAVRVEPGRARQRVTAAGGGALPPVPEGWSAELEFTAGFGGAAGPVPGDLAQAVMLLAARYHEDRSGEGAGGIGGVPAAVTALLGPYRPVRL
jgi:uncharacterized phiE125 gp8 family phage protein